MSDTSFLSADPELRSYYMGKYNERAILIDIIMLHQDKPCIGEECEEGHICVRHDRSVDLANRILRKRCLRE